MNEMITSPTSNEEERSAQALAAHHSQNQTTAVLPRSQRNYTMEHPALTFLDLLDSRDSARFCIETYTDAKDKPRPDPLSKQYRDLSRKDVAALIPKLAAHNEKGAAIYVAVNAFRGRRNKDNLARVRGVHADLDGATDAEIEAVREKLMPSIEVRTSEENHLHMYWLTPEGEPLQPWQAENINKALVGLGADKAASDVTRLLRLPGFKHLKHCGPAGYGTAPIVEVLSHNGAHKVGDILSAFPMIGWDDDAPPEPSENGSHVSGATVAEAANTYADFLAKFEEDAKLGLRELWGGDWAACINVFSGEREFPSQSEADYALCRQIARDAANRGIPKPDAPAVIEAVFELSALAERDKWQTRADYRERTISNAMDGLFDDHETDHSDVDDGAFVTEDALREAKVRWEFHGDVRTSRYFVDLYRDRLFFERGSGTWYRWHNERWKRCEKGEELQAAKMGLHLMAKEAANTAVRDPGQSSKRLRECAEAQREQRMKAMLNLAKSERGMSATPKELDGEPYHLGVGNGVVNLKTGVLEENTPKRLITRHCRANYDPDATAPQWEKFLSEVFAGDDETIAAVQKLLGLTLTGVSHEEVMIFAYGTGANGKTIFNNVIFNILGDYAVHAPSSLLAARRADDSAPRSDIAMLAGARLVVINELPAGMQLDETVTKQLAGAEVLSARHLYQAYFSFLPMFTPWVRTNHRPVIKGTDNGIWRRIRLLKFGQEFEEKVSGGALTGALLAERSGILTWCVRGAMAYISDGLVHSKSMQKDLQQYRSESDLMGSFLDEETEACDDGKVVQRDLYVRWQTWCEDNGIKRASKRSFTERLTERGFGVSKSGSKRYYTGLKLKT